MIVQICYWAGAFWLGFSLGKFGNIYYNEKRFYAILVPTVLLIGLGRYLLLYGGN